MQRVRRHESDGIRPEGHFLVFEDHIAAASAAEADFQAVMEMQPAAAHRADAPFLALKHDHRKIHRQFVITVFGNAGFRSGHGDAPFFLFRLHYIRNGEN